MLALHDFLGLALWQSRHSNASCLDEERGVIEEIVTRPCDCPRPLMGRWSQTLLRLEHAQFGLKWTRGERLHNHRPNLLP